MELLFWPMRPFVMHPERIAVVSAAFVIAATWIRIRGKSLAWPILVAGLCWATFAFWEGYCNAQGYNIRVDLLLISPLLLVVTLWGAAEIFVPGIAARPIPSRFSLRSLLITMTAIALALGTIAWLAK